jgi:hypothetical protein
VKAFPSIEAGAISTTGQLMPQRDAGPAIAIIGQFIGSKTGMDGAPTALLNRSV